MASYRTAVRQSRRESRDRIVAAATELVRHRPYAALTVDEVMREAGFGRTIFYRHFDDLADLLMRAGREAVEGLLAASEELAAAPMGDGPDAVRAAIRPAVEVYERHGPLLRAIAEAAAAGDEQIAAGQERMRRRFDEVLAEALGALPAVAANPPADIAETARALNLMNQTYLQETFGREPRASAETAVETLTEIWLAVIHRGGAGG